MAQLTYDIETMRPPSTAGMCRAAGHDPNAIVTEGGARHGPTYLMVKFWARQAQEQLKCQR